HHPRGGRTNMAGPKVAFIGDYAVATRGLLAQVLTRPAELVDVPSAASVDALTAALADAEAAVSMGWPAGMPPAPRLRLLQVPGTGTERIELAAVPQGATLCNAFGHEEAIGEYAVLAMLCWCHRFVRALRTFRAGSWEMGSHGGGGVHDE